MINALLRGGRLVHDRLTALKWEVGDSVLYPFDHAREGTTLGRFALPSLPDPQAIGDLYQLGTEAQDRLIDLHRRVLGVWPPPPRPSSARSACYRWNSRHPRLIPSRRDRPYSSLAGRL